MKGEIMIKQEILRNWLSGWKRLYESQIEDIRFKSKARFHEHKDEKQRRKYLEREIELLEALIKIVNNAKEWGWDAEK